MMTWIARLCTLCAMSTLMQMVLPEDGMKSSIRLICGLLMLRLTLLTVSEMGAMLGKQTDLAGIIGCLLS